MKRLFLIINSLLFIFLTIQSADASMTRDLVFEDEAPSPLSDSSKQSIVAVKTIVELERNGEKKNVAPNFEFQSGDRVKIIYTTNIDCHAYWISQGSSGGYVMLFPNAKTGTDNWVKKNQENTIPISGTFKFDEKPGVEKIMLIMSPEKIPDLEQAASEAMIKGGKINSSSGNVNNVLASNQSKRKTRDLVFEEEDNKDTNVATMIQKSTDIKQPFVTSYELTHK